MSIFTDEKREKIKIRLLEIGINMIKQKGIKKMIIDDVTEGANIGKGTFYHFFKSKEDYVYKVIRFNKEKILEYINNAIEEKGGIDKETFLNLLQKFSFTSGDNVISFITREDEEWLKKKLPKETKLDTDEEDHIAALIFGHAIGAKQNLNYHVIENILKIMAITSENKDELHEDALEQNLLMMMNMLCNYIYEN
ncbi:TetR/AcrR family transcriptional regulator [Clostridium sp. CT7]|uniref:TetR/AcrR family transcriptional regulator n=2 Tax=Clostridium TaxID=1485 RepID=UPI00082512A6|nr:TetR/AcrR family transcriptional regulator [Clostridium sp. CT7]